MPLTDKQKENIISEALGTPEGRTALAQAMVEPIAESLELLGTYHNVMQEPTKEIALECLSRYEKNIVNGKVYSEHVVESINKIYDQWDIERGGAINILIKNRENIIDSRFDILDL